MKHLAAALLLFSGISQCHGALCTLSDCTTTVYRSIADNPFLQGIQAGTMYLEDFEDGRSNAPFIDEEASGGGGRTTIGVTQFLAGENNSVDGDDGVVDGADLLGAGWMGLGRGDLNIDFVFEAKVAANGSMSFPTYFGFAITAGIGNDETYISFTDEDENFLGTFHIRANDLPEYTAGQRGVATDRFVAMHIPTGAEIMHIRQGIYTIDHLTYGWDPVPEPCSAALTATALTMLMRRRRGMTPAGSRTNP
jgi:hypothetical protein